MKEKSLGRKYFVVIILNSFIKCFLSIQKIFSKRFFFLVEWGFERESLVLFLFTQTSSLFNFSKFSDSLEGKTACDREIIPVISSSEIFTFLKKFFSLKFFQRKSSKKDFSKNFLNSNCDFQRFSQQKL